VRPEEKFDFPLLSSWEYGWRLGEWRLHPLKLSGTGGFEG